MDELDKTIAKIYKHHALDAGATQPLSNMLNAVNAGINLAFGERMRIEDAKKSTFGLRDWLAHNEQTTAR
jgi:hypothetical protein